MPWISKTSSPVRIPFCGLFVQKIPSTIMINSLNNPVSLLYAMNLAYNTDLAHKARFDKARLGPQATLPSPSEAVLTWHERAQLWLAQAQGRQWVSIHSPDYPNGLLALKDPPLILFLEGDTRRLNQRGIAMVGSRNASQTGLGIARQWATHLASQQWNVVSGLAEGIDGAAHEGALAGGGQTIAVLGGGLDHIYPKHHTGLANSVVEQGGLLVSEYPPGTPPQPAFFPRRNRIIAGLADALVVVEAAIKSGSLITAKLASELGRPVLAVPGSIHSPHSKGCHAMIKQGALLAETTLDVLEETKACLAPGRTEAKPLLHKQDTQAPFGEDITSQTPLISDFSPQEQDPAMAAVMAKLTTEPQHVDLITAACGLDVDAVVSALVELELMGQALCESGNRWVICPGN